MSSRSSGIQPQAYSGIKCAAGRQVGPELYGEAWELCLLPAARIPLARACPSHACLAGPQPARLARAQEDAAQYDCATGRPVDSAHRAAVNLHYVDSADAADAALQAVTLSANAGGSSSAGAGTASVYPPIMVRDGVGSAVVWVGPGPGMVLRKWWGFGWAGGAQVMTGAGSCLGGCAHLSLAAQQQQRFEMLTRRAECSYSSRMLAYPFI